MDTSPFARTLARAAMGVLAESEDPRGHPAPAPDPRATPRMRTALVQLFEAGPADLEALETAAVSLLDARESLDARADANHRELEAADGPQRDSGTDGGAWNRLLDHHVAFAESSVLLGVTATLLEYCGRRVGWAREWQVEMQPFRARAESRVGHPGRIGRFAAVAKLRKRVPEHLLEVPEKDWDMLFRDAYWGISYASTLTCWLRSMTGVTFTFPAT